MIGTWIMAIVGYGICLFLIFGTLLSILEILFHPDCIGKRKMEAHAEMYARAVCAVLVAVVTRWLAGL